MIKIKRVPGFVLHSNRITTGILMQMHGFSEEEAHAIQDEMGKCKTSGYYSITRKT